jgi:hypothetical protein
MKLDLLQKLLLAATLVIFASSSFAANVSKTKKNTQTQPASNTTAEVAQPAPAPAFPAPISTLQPLAGEQIKWQVISGGGVRGTSPSYVLSSTIGQTAVGLGTSPSYKLNQGFWQNFSATSCKCGDANGDNIFNVSDAVFLISYIFGGGAAPNPICHGDANGDAKVNVSDAVFLIAYIFAGGAAPHCP